MTAPKTAPEKPKFQVVGDTFIAQTTDQGELAIRLNFKFKLLRRVRDSGGDEIDQFFNLLDGIGDQETLDKLDELDAIEATELIGAYFREFGERQQASLGESSRSSS
jgi:hypothetical protein